MQKELIFLATLAGVLLSTVCVAVSEENIDGPQVLQKILAAPVEPIQPDLPDLLDPAEFSILEEDFPEIDNARQRFSAALQASPEMQVRCGPAVEHFNRWVKLAGANTWGINGSHFGGPGGPVFPAAAAEQKARFYEAFANCMGAPQLGPPPTIRFGPDSTELTPESRAVIREIVRTAEGRPLSVVGHADTSGSKAYNQKLSTERAQAISTEIMKFGGNVISFSGEGESQPMRSTGDGVREPSNRRGEILVVDRETGQPVAMATVSGVFPRAICTGSNPTPMLPDMALRLQLAFQRSDMDPRLFVSDDGFAVASQGKEVEEKEKPESFWSIFKAPKPPLMRIILIVVSKSTISGGQTNLGQNELIERIRSGRIRLGDELANLPFTAAHHCTAFVYVFRWSNYNDETGPVLLDGKRAGKLLGFNNVRRHLEDSGISAELAREN